MNIDEQRKLAAMIRAKTEVPQIRLERNNLNAIQPILLRKIWAQLRPSVL